MLNVYDFKIAHPETFKQLSVLMVSVAIVSFLSGCQKDMVGSPDISISDSHSEKSAMVPGSPQILVSGLQGASGSAVGPDGALYVTEGAVGKISRIDPKTGEVTTFASGFPPSLIGIGGVYDVTFIDETAYALVTVVDDPTLL